MFKLKALMAFVCAALPLLTAGACFNAPDRAAIEEHEYNNFQTVVARAPQDGYTPYWLGRGFQAGGLNFRGPNVGGLASAVDGGGVSMSYDADVLKAGAVGLDVRVYSAAAWAKKPPVSSSGRTVQVAGHAATLIATSGGGRPVLQMALIMHIEDTTVVVVAAAGGPATPGGSELNPLVDERTFLDVVQQLRPYPQ